MQRNKDNTLQFPIFLIVLGGGSLVLLGWWLAKFTLFEPEKVKIEQEAVAPVVTSIIPNTPSKSSNRTANKSAQDEGEYAIPNESLLQFSSEAAYKRALKILKKKGLVPLNQNAGLLALRLSDDDFAVLRRHLKGEDYKKHYNYQVNLPAPLSDKTLPVDAKAFKGELLSWLGVEGDISHWGDGQSIAILDTGLSAHPDLPEGIRQIDVTNSPANHEYSLHGNGVTSLLFGKGRVVQGLTPAADPLFVRVFDNEGNGNSFSLAAGINEAVRAGVDFINISAGSQYDSLLVRREINSALDKGILVFVSPGNEGADRLAYPSAYEGVISPSAIDYNGKHMPFSNKGEGVNISAPGLGVYAAHTDEKYFAFTGTSASSPIALGATVGVMSELGLSANEAYEHIVTYADEAGPVGYDSKYGHGIINIDRALNHDQPGRYDGAHASLGFSENNGVSTATLVFENRGTENIINSTLAASLDGVSYEKTLPFLAPNETYSWTIPATAPENSSNPKPVYSGTILLEGGNDLQQRNDSYSRSFDNTED